MAQRINYFSRYMPNEFGVSEEAGMVPKGTLKPSKVNPENLTQDISALKNQAQQAQNSKVESADSSKPFEDPTSLIGDAAGAVNTAKNLTGSSFGKNGKTWSPKGAGIAAGATAIAGIAGGALSNNKKEVAGEALSGAAAGASAGMMLGPIGAAVGAGIGAGLGAIKGVKQKRMREETEAKNKRWNKKMDALAKQSLTQADDLEAYKGLLSSFEQGGVVRFRTGGLIKYKELNIDKAKAYIAKLEQEQEKEKGKLENTPIYKCGGRVHKAGYGQKLEKIKKKKPTFKKGGKTTKCKKGGKCGCKKCGTALVVPIFRRGGKADLEKLNVIVDGPSHSEENNTGIKGDKGLPVVFNGKKVAEIESHELVINSASTKELEELVKKAKKDPKAKEELAERLAQELQDNTYDYSDLLS